MIEPAAPDHAADPEANGATETPPEDVSGYKAKPQHMMPDGSVIVADTLGDLMEAVEAAHVFPTEAVE